MKKSGRFKHIEARYFLFASHLTLFVVAVVEYNLPRTILQLASAYLVGAGTELALHYWLKKYPKATAFDRTLSAVSEAAGLLLLVRSTLWYYYAIATFVAVVSKYVFTRHDGVHVFNPTNFAIVFGLALFPLNSFELNPDEYSVHTYAILHVMAFGMLAVAFGGTYFVTIGYFVGIVGAATFAPLFGWTGYAGVLFPEIGAFGMIFAFLMITDPRTTPARHPFKFLFGFAIAIGVLVLRSLQVAYPNFLSLFVITLATFALSFVFPSIYRSPKKTKVMPNDGEKTSTTMPAEV
jgi:enediyne biosynthesis protein E5